MNIDEIKSDSFELEMRGQMESQNGWIGNGTADDTEPLPVAPDGSGSRSRRGMGQTSVRPPRLLTLPEPDARASWTAWAQPASWIERPAPGSPPAETALESATAMAGRTGSTPAQPPLALEADPVASETQVESAGPRVGALDARPQAAASIPSIESSGERLRLTSLPAYPTPPPLAPQRAIEVAPRSAAARQPEAPRLAETPAPPIPNLVAAGVTASNPPLEFPPIDPPQYHQPPEFRESGGSRITQPSAGKPPREVSSRDAVPDTLPPTGEEALPERRRIEFLLSAAAGGRNPDGAAPDSGMEDQGGDAERGSGSRHALESFGAQPAAVESPQSNLTASSVHGADSGRAVPLDDTRRNTHPDAKPAETASEPDPPRPQPAPPLRRIAVQLPDERAGNIEVEFRRVDRGLAVAIDSSAVAGARLNRGLDELAAAVRQQGYTLSAGKAPDENPPGWTRSRDDGGSRNRRREGEARQGRRTGPRGNEVGRV